MKTLKFQQIANPVLLVFQELKAYDYAIMPIFMKQIQQSFIICFFIMNINLETINWFGSVGNYTDGKDIGLPIKAVGTQAEMIQNLESIDWGNFILYAKNRLSWYIKTFHKEQGKGWNDIARQAQEWYGKSGALIAEAARQRDIGPLALPYCRAIWISYYLERYYYNKVSREIPMHFDKISTIYLAGHIPCGWEGPIPENRGYDAIDLNEGKILIW